MNLVYTEQNIQNPKSLKTFGTIFNQRHSFDSDDHNTLQNNFPDIKFSCIPDAWIILIDNMLRKIGSHVVEVQQFFGLFIVRLKNIKQDTLDICNKTISFYEKRLYLIDQDLHAEFK